MTSPKKPRTSSFSVIETREAPGLHKVRPPSFQRQSTELYEVGWADKVVLWLDVDEELARHNGVLSSEWFATSESNALQRVARGAHSHVSFRPRPARRRATTSCAFFDRPSWR